MNLPVTGFHQERSFRSDHQRWRLTWRETTIRWKRQHGDQSEFARRDQTSGIQNFPLRLKPSSPQRDAPQRQPQRGLPEIQGDRDTDELGEGRHRSSQSDSLVFPTKIRFRNAPTAMIPTRMGFQSFASRPDFAATNKPPPTINPVRPYSATLSPFENEA